MLDRVRLFLFALLSSLLITAVILQVARGSQPGVPVTLLPPPTLAPSATPAATLATFSQTCRGIASDTRA